MRFRQAVLAALFVVCPVSAAAPTAEVKPGENLVVEGVPAIPAALAEEVRPYTEARAAIFTSWNPKRHEMLIATRFGNTYQAHVVKAPGAARTQLTFYADGVFGGHFDRTNGNAFVFSKDRGGDEFYQLYLYELGGGRVTLLTDGRSRNTGPVWSNSGRWMAYGSTRRTGNDVDVYVVDPSDPKSDRRVVDLSGGGWTVNDWSPDDKTLLLTEGISVNETYLWRVDVASGQKTLLTPKGKGKVSYGNAAFAKDGKGLFVTLDAGSEFQRLARLDPVTGKVELLTPDTADVDEFDLSPDGKRIAYVANEKGAGILHLFDIETRTDRAAPGIPIGIVSGVRWHPDGSLVGFTLGSARSSHDAYALDVRTGTVERWTTSELGGLNPETFVEPELVAWKSFDGREITGFLYRPDPARFPGKRPVVVDIHGGPEGQSRPEFMGRDNYLMSELGVAIILPNVRGSTGFGKTFSLLDNGFLREGTYKDIAALFDWIAARPDLDASRVMVEGGSYGGHMTLAVATFYSDRIRCAVDVVGPSNLVTFLEHTSGYRQDLRRVEYGDERDPKMRAFLEKIAPMTNAEKIRKPLFVVQGYNDPRVPRSESEQMVARIRKIGTPVWYLMAKDEGHGFAKKSNRDFEFYATVEFMKEYLLAR